MSDKERLKEIEITRHNLEKIVVPTDDVAPLPVIIWNLQQQHAKNTEEEQFVEIYETVDCSVWDGAIAMNKAIEQTFKVNFVTASTKETIFGTQIIPVSYHSVETSFDETIQIPWGKILIPFLEGGYVNPSSTKKNGKIIFQFYAYVKKRHEARIKELGDLTREIARKESIYRGKAFRVEFLNPDGTEKPIPEVRFMDLSGVRIGELIFNAETQYAIEINIFNPIKFTERCRKNSIPLKRGVLLAGTFGTGKTLTAYTTARMAANNGWSFIYCKSVDELTNAIHFASQYSPCIVFCEDIDKAVTGKRDNQMDYLFNTIDGVDTKNAEIMMILTTNNLKDMHKGMLRPGRIDALIQMTSPDSKTVEKLVRLYSRNLLAENEDLSKVSEELKGEIPAVIAEVVEKAKLASMSVDNGGLGLTAEALYKSAVSMRTQRNILKAEERTDMSTAEKAAQINGEALGKSLGTSLGKAVTELSSNLAELGSIRPQNWSKKDTSVTGNSVDESSLQLVNGSDKGTDG